MWPAPARYGEMGMFVVAPAASFHHHESLIPDAIPSSNAAAIGVIPLFNVTGEIDGHDLTTPTHNRNRTAGVGVPLHLWQNQQQIGNENNNNNYAKKTIDFESAGGGNSLSSATATCQDCGNQAKKDCPHRRCRTCCRSKGLDCSTHVKSTWVPAARRRERQMIAGVAGVSLGSTSGAKKPRMIMSSATTTSSNTVDTGSSGHHEAAAGDGGGKGSMPAEVKAPAVFKCVRVTAVEGGEDEFAYQAMVKIRGHVFKGLLYDKGAHHIPSLSELHLGGGATACGGGGGERNGVSSTPIGFPATEVYGSSAGGYHGGGSTFGNTIN